jgi:diaminopimelate epimerase
MSFRLVKTHAYGNDFLLVRAEDVPAGVSAATLARETCDRHWGIGADGLLVISERPRGAAMRLFNADGSPSEVSGNGVRCIGAWLARQRGLGPGAELVIDTDAGPKGLTLLREEEGRWTLRASMGQPEAIRQETLLVGGDPVEVVTLRVGNPQCVVLGPATLERLHALGRPLAVHSRFPEGTNVAFAEVESPGRVRILIWERGVGPTESSGTGACGAAVAAAAHGGGARDVEIVAPGGTQRVEWTPEGLWLTGWAVVVADVTWFGREITPGVI